MPIEDVEEIGGDFLVHFILRYHDKLRVLLYKFICIQHVATAIKIISTKQTNIMY